jgi:hypothetical protein
MSGVAILLMLASAISLAEGSTAGLTVSVTGSGGFKGTATINRFELSGSQIVAIGVVRNAAGTAFAGVTWPVTVTSKASSLSATSGQASKGAHLTRASWSPDNRSGARLVPVQATSCGVLTINLGATTVNLGGAQVSLNPITLDISGQSGTPVGDLVCAALNTLSNVAGLVDVLNNLLAALIGALGGLTDVV